MRIRLFRLSVISIALILPTIVILDHWYPPPIPQQPDYSTLVVDHQGRHLRRYTTADGYWRLPVDSQQLDSDYLKLLLAYEDKRFYQHSGVDLLALLRASGQFISQGRVVSGGSTLTMQLVRLLEPRSRTLGSKLLEILRAWQIEARLDKNTILKHYLELAPFGGNLQGVRAASLFYFGKEPRFLTMDEAALLVALPQSPESRRPDRFPTRARLARNHVIMRLAGHVIQPGDVQSLLAKPVPHKRQSSPMLAPHLADRLRKQHKNSLLTTSIDADLQSRSQKLLAHFQEKQPKGVTLAALIVDNRTRQTRAYIGTADYFATGFPGQVDMVRAIRSPGSTLKPFIYGLGFEQQIMHPKTLINDSPDRRLGYAPANFDGRYLGGISARQALIQSRNLPAVKALLKLGPHRFMERMQNAGITLHLPGENKTATLPIALGGVGIRFEQLVSLYAALANQGQLKSITYTDKTNSSVSLSGPVSEKRLLSAAATWYLTDILADANRPAGYRLSQRNLAFKTGTAYGYRDAWAIGYNADYTIGVWLGRPDGGYTQRLYGLKDAVPVMLELFDLVPDSGLGQLLMDRPSEVIAAKHAELPTYLQHLDPAAGTHQLLVKQSTSQPKIVFPINDSKLVFNGAKSILIEGRGGKSPYFWLENSGKRIARTDIPMMEWLPNARGKITLTMLDSQGKADQITVTVEQD